MINASVEKLVKSFQNEKGPAEFVQSELFARTFRDGMALVEETANYLDGEGRKDSKELSRDAALSYASASMRLTTKLMQIASWLLVLRAVREGEMNINDAADSKYRLKPDEETMLEYAASGMPERLINLVENTQSLYRQISRLDVDIFIAEEKAYKETDAAGQQRALLKAFTSPQ